jgi:hypothetical protein
MAAGPQARVRAAKLGRGEAAAAGCWARLGRRGRLGNKRVWTFWKGFTQREFKLLNLNSSNQKKCSSMYATINSYVSLILFRKI